jgi:hypothetical protein
VTFIKADGGGDRPARTPSIGASSARSRERGQPEAPVPVQSPSERFPTGRELSCAQLGCWPPEVDLASAPRRPRSHRSANCVPHESKADPLDKHFHILLRLNLKTSEHSCSASLMTSSFLLPQGTFPTAVRCWKALPWESFLPFANF